MADNKFNVELHSLAPSAIIELFELHIMDGPILYFHAGTNELRQSIVWAGNTYQYFGIQLTGMETSASGPAPSPKVQVANPNGYMSVLSMQYDGFSNALFLRKRTFKRFLDSVNFAAANPEADPTQMFPIDVYKVEHKSGETKDGLEFTLATPFDAEGIQMPRRRVIANMCSWVYRGAECGYTGSNYFTASDISTPSAGLDVCGKRTTSCICRFGNSPLPFGGFPASDKVAR